MPVQSLSKIICHYLSCTILYVQDAFDGDFGTSSVNTFVTGIIMPQAYPHIAVYYPSHASFEVHDVILAVYNGNDKRKLRRYQLRKGKALPRNIADSV